MTNIVLVLTTVPDGDLGDIIARTLVEERLAACVNICAPMTSVYRWEGHVRHDGERQLVIKTTADRVEDVRVRMAHLHTYVVPELLVLAVSDGSAAYLEWVGRQSASPE